MIHRAWTIEATAERFQVDAKTVRKWRDRFVAECTPGLLDRSSRLRRSPNQSPTACRRRIIELRKTRRWGATHIGFEVGRAGSTVQKILTNEGLGRLDVGGRASKAPVVRYQRDRPGEVDPRILLEEWACIRDWHSYRERTTSPASTPRGLARGDGPIMQYRRWCEQFYAEGVDRSRTSTAHVHSGPHPPRSSVDRLLSSEIPPVERPSRLSRFPAPPT